ncbi:MAG: TRAP transporter permease [Beijerinckiaceae bacterium]
MSPNTDTSEPSERGFRALQGGWLLLSRTILVALPVTMILFALHIPSDWLGVTLWREHVALLVLSLALAATFIAVPAFAGRSAQEAAAPPAYDVVLAVLALAVSFRTAWNYEELMSSGYAGISQGAYLNVACSVLMILLVLEAIRRFTGWPLVILSVAFICYGATAEKFPGVFGGRKSDFDSLLLYLNLDTAGLLGAPISVVISVVFAYILLGSALFRLGGGQMFIDLAIASMGRFRGGSAKAAVVASSLFGTVSGSAVANVATTGIVTIPMMKKAGFPPNRAGAVEAVASTGGQLMPPIMGAAAFIMADFLNVPYAQVALAALFPALLFYFAVFVQIHLAARKAGMLPVPAEERPRVSDTLAKYWPFLVPIAALIYFLFFTGLQADAAAIWTTVVIFAAAMVRKETRPDWRKLLEVLEATGRSLLDLIAITGAAGFVIGVLSISGLGFSLSLAIVQLSGGNIAVLLALTAFTALVLGMGMPTTAVYILMATLIAPALVKAGINPFAAHLFVLYYGVLSMITPPVCLASFTAASIARAGFMDTGWQSVKLGFVTFLVPLLFVASPALLLQGDSKVEIVRALVTGFAGCVFVAAGFEGFLGRVLNAAQRVLAFVAGIALMLPEGEKVSGFWAGYSDKTGAALAVLLLVWLFFAGKQAGAAGPAPEKA